MKQNAYNIEECLEELKVLKEKISVERENRDGLKNEQETLEKRLESVNLQVSEIPRRIEFCEKRKDAINNSEEILSKCVNTALKFTWWDVTKNKILAGVLLSLTLLCIITQEALLLFAPAIGVILLLKQYIGWYKIESKEAKSLIGKKSIEEVDEDIAELREKLKELQQEKIDIEKRLEVIPNEYQEACKIISCMSGLIKDREQAIDFYKQSTDEKRIFEKVFQTTGVTKRYVSIGSIDNNPTENPKKVTLKRKKDL